MVGLIVLGLLLAPAVLFFVLMIGVALRRPERYPMSSPRPRPDPRPEPRPTPRTASPPSVGPTLSTEPPTSPRTSTRSVASSPEFTAWLAAYRRAHPNATHQMEIAAVREWRDDRTKYRGMSPGMKAAHKAVEEQRRGTGWDGDWAR
ncbi:hypothetical protein [Streptacidiphilus fuscans]|uniref:Uncharacterized protein n=1 Tax=Streptacidiphilus fuscans TaxID=2789292 RepID=A0A931FD51_9ACTN|nr:hypothetical protein [Streptacidiphilus fuscans]MBF9069198.1 hypothetical protein [Streptacidiphilus fuscans]